MKMTDVIRQELMLLPAQATTKEQILDEMVQKLLIDKIGELEYE